MKKLLFISSTGGHLTELLQLSPLFEDYEYRIVTEKTKSNLILKKKYPGKVRFLIYGTKSHLFSYIFKFGYNVVKSLFIYLMYRPDFIISTGAHTSVPMCYIGKLFRSRIIYIETFANIKSKSMSGKLVYPIADLFLVQWENMLSLYPRAKYVGGLF